MPKRANAGAGRSAYDHPRDAEPALRKPQGSGRRREVATALPTAAPGARGSLPRYGEPGQSERARYLLEGIDILPSPNR
jgi:hypothetical protein